jgi:predicted Zn-dependent peptidase
MGLESPAARAERMARMLAVWDRLPPLDETLAKIAAVTPADARAFAETLVSRAAPAVALLGPVRKAPSQARLAGRMAA